MPDIAPAVVCWLLIGVCFATGAEAAGSLPSFLPRHRPARPNSAQWTSVQAVLPQGTPPPTRDPLTHAFTFNTRRALTIVPGFSQIKFGTQATALSKPAIHHEGELFICRADALRLKSLISTAADSTTRTTQRRREKLLIVIDPGHGGHDPGASGHGIREKDVNLKVATNLKPILESQGFEVKLTRADDTFIRLEERPAIANRLRADLFVSIHTNSEPSGRVTGIETFYCDKDRRYNPIARGLAAAKNGRLDALKLGLTYEPDSEMRKIVFGLLIEDARYKSRRLAAVVQNTLVEHMAAASRGTKPGALRVLRLVNCPGILIETGFLSNRYEAARLRDPAYQAKLAKGIAKGLVRYAAIDSDGSDGEGRR